MKSTSPLHIRNHFVAIRPIVRRELLLLALGAFLLAGTAGWAVQPQASMSAAVLSSAAPQPVRVATATQQKLAAAAVAEGVQIEWNTGLGTPFSVRGKDLGARQTFSAGKGLQTAKAARPEANAIAVLDNLSGIMGIQDAQNEFSARPAKSDSLGMRHVRTDQTYQGLKVFGGEVIVHFNQAGTAYQVNGRYVPNIAVDINPQVTSNDALRLVTEDLTNLGKSSVAPLRQPELVVFAYKTAPRLAYALTMTCEPTAENTWRYWIDAQDGKVLMRYNDVKMITITGAILTGEGGTTNTVNNCLSVGVTNYLESTNWQWLVYNISTNSALYPDDDNTAFRTNTSWGTSDRTEMSAAYNFDLIQKYYWTINSRQSYDNSNSSVSVFVHYENSSFANNAAWLGYGLMLIGEGDGTTASGMAVLDVCGHEFTHGVTEYSANLIYAYESGALNESFSDIFGASIEFNSQPDGRTNYPGKVAGTADWLIGEDGWLSHTALRDMRNPSNPNTVGIGHEQPRRYQGTYWYTGTGDNGGVHQNDSVQNFFFYLLSEGGSGVNDGHAYSVAGIGITNAAKIAYLSLTAYCHPYTDYTDIRDAWISAAQELNPAWVASVIQAWEAVGYGIDTVADLGTALNAPYLTWYTGANASWYGQSLITHDGVAAAQSGLINNGMSSRLSTTVTGPGTLSFWWKVWSDQNHDYLRFYIDSNLRMQISGLSNWANSSFSVGAGMHTFKWQYSKDAAGSSGLDAGWVDEVSWAPDWNPTVPTITATSGNFSDRIRITWPAMSGATGYRLYRSGTTNAGEASLLSEPSGPLYDDTGAVPGTTYYYWMQGVNCATYARWSSSASGYRALVPPTGFSASKGGYTRNVQLTWVAALGATSYRIMRSTSADPNTASVIVETGATSYNDTTAAPGTTYYYWLISRKWRQGPILESVFSTGDYGWRRSMAATDSAFCDFDGDGKADPAIYQSATGQWIVMMSANRYQTRTFLLGGAGFMPVPQDYDGDGRTDIAVYSQASGQWIFLLSSSGYSSATINQGGPVYMPIPRDFDGDGRADPSVFNQSSGLWQIRFSSRRYALVQGMFGDSSYSPCPADYDNDGKTDPAVFQVQQSVLGKLGYFISLSPNSAGAYTSHSSTISAYGQTVPQDYDGDAKADLALFNAAAGLWSFWPSSMISAMPFSFTIGGAGCVPVPGDYDGDKKADPAVYQESTGTWVFLLSASNYAPLVGVFGGPGYEPAAAFP